MNPETSLKNKILSYLKKQNCLYFKISDKFFSGIPDLYILFNGRSVWVEIKTTTGKLSKIQEYTINEIIKNGGEAFVIRSVDEIKKIFS